MRIVRYCLTFFLVLTFLTGCSIVLQKGRRSDVERIRTLEQQLDELRDARSILEERLAEEIKGEQVRVSMEEKGLVVTFVAEILFDSGKAKLKPESSNLLKKVSRVLEEEVPQNQISIEGHTDNQPIKLSQWKSNWELSTQRALSVLHFLEQQGVSPKRMYAIGYGEYSPVASNDTKAGRALNRRVEIVIIPLDVKKIKKELGEF
ncbi:MAG: OmpA family protein [Candidatus Omnitrophica bacterium]|nr:OmpA family protein [Candidatus Omnitrophota bacterium]